MPAAPSPAESSSPGRSFAGRLSRSAVGRASGRLSRAVSGSVTDRPADALSLLAELDACRVDGRWTAADAAAWWAAPVRAASQTATVAAEPMPDATAIFEGGRDAD